MRVRDFLIENQGPEFSLMTPGGYVDLTPEQVQELLDGKSIKVHPGIPHLLTCHGVLDLTTEIEAEELLKQKVFSSRFEDGVYYLMTYYPQEEEHET